MVGGKQVEYKQGGGFNPTGQQERTFALAERTVNAEARTVDVAISSEYPVDRWGGNEVLVHEPTAVRLGRLSDKGAVLFNHHRDDLLGVVEAVRLDGDRRLRATVRFSEDAEAQRRFKQVEEGVLNHISIGYSVLAYQEVPAADGGKPTLRITDWEPYEVSFVTVPADPTVGKGRALGGKETAQECGNEKAEDETCGMVCVEPLRGKGDDVMNANELTVAAPVAVAQKDPVAQLGALRDMAQLAGVNAPADVALSAFSRGLAPDGEAYRAELMKLQAEKRAAAPVVQDTVSIGMTDKDVARYSISRAIMGQLENSSVDWGYEREISQEMQRKLGAAPNGFYVPFEAMSRTIGASVGFSAANGSNTVPTDMLGFIDLLRQDLVVMSMGATMLTGLSGNVSIPRLNQGLAAGWVLEGAPRSSDDTIFSQVTLSPKTLSAKAQYTRQLLAQSSLDVEYLIVQELARASAYKLQEAIINGSGSGAEPQGILGLSGTVTIPTGGIATNGGALTRSHLVDLEAALAAAGPAARPLQFLTNPKVRGAMKKTPVDTGSGLFVYDERDKNLLGYPTAVTNAVPSNLVKGTSGAVCSALILADWSELILANWGALDIKPWPKEDGIVTVQAMQLWDIGYKHTNSFGVIKDITT